MNLRAVDLNLLVIFDAIMAERHVTRAARRIAMSQPAMSNALSRLRHVFQDELFIRIDGRMEPTPRAIELGAAVRQIVRQTERLMTSDVGFDPRTSSRRFVARMSDLVGYLVLPGVIKKLRNAAPSIALNILPMSPATLGALEADTLDFAISMELVHSRSIRSKQLFQDEMCCLMGEQHPLAQRKLSLSAFLEHPHLQVAMGPDHTPVADLVLAERGERRNIAVTVPHWLLVPSTLRSADLLAVVSRKLAARFAGTGVLMKPLPFKSAPLFWSIYWHRRNDKSAAHIWMREVVMNVCHDLR